MPLDDATSPPLTTPADLQALRERWQEASPGDWHAYRPHDDWVVRHDEENVILRTHSTSDQAQANVTFVCSVHNALPRLLATIEALQARIAELERGGGKGKG